MSLQIGDTPRQWRRLPFPVAPNLISVIKTRCSPTNAGVLDTFQQGNWFCMVFTPLTDHFANYAQNKTANRVEFKYDIDATGNVLINSMGPFCAIVDDTAQADKIIEIHGQNITGYVEILIQTEDAMLKYAYKCGDHSDAYPDFSLVDLKSANCTVSTCNATSVLLTSAQKEMYAKMLACNRPNWDSALTLANNAGSVLLYAKIKRMKSTHVALTDNAALVEQYENMGNPEKAIKWTASNWLFDGTGWSRWAGIMFDKNTAAYVQCDQLESSVSPVIVHNCMLVPYETGADELLVSDATKLDNAVAALRLFSGEPITNEHVTTEYETLYNKLSESDSSQFDTNTDDLLSGLKSAFGTEFATVGALLLVLPSEKIQAKDIAEIQQTEEVAASMIQDKPAWAGQILCWLGNQTEDSDLECAKTGSPAFAFTDKNLNSTQIGQIYNWCKKNEEYVIETYFKTPNLKFEFNDPNFTLQVQIDDCTTQIDVPAESITEKILFFVHDDKNSEAATEWAENLLETDIVGHAAKRFRSDPGQASYAPASPAPTQPATAADPPPFTTLQAGSVSARGDSKTAPGLSDDPKTTPGPAPPKARAPPSTAARATQENVLLPATDSVYAYNPAYQHVHKIQIQYNKATVTIQEEPGVLNYAKGFFRTMSGFVLGPKCGFGTRVNFHLSDNAAATIESNYTYVCKKAQGWQLYAPGYDNSTDPEFIKKFNRRLAMYDSHLSYFQ